MRLYQLLEGAGCVGPLPRDVEVKGISYDTRTIKPGELYVALRGYKTDGHSYMDEARARGAAAVVCAPPLPQNVPGICIPADDPRAALALLAGEGFVRSGVTSEWFEVV